jgi:hypothetical protein
LLTAGALLTLAGLVIVFGFLEWIFPGSRVDLLDRFRPGPFTSLAVLVAPLLAVLVAARLGPPVRPAQLVGLVALGQYAVALVLGGLGFLLSLAGRFDGLGGGIYAFGGALQRVGDVLITLVQLGLLALAGLWALQIFTSLGGRLPWASSARAE